MTRPTPLVFLDTETTGLRPDEHTPWEVAWVTALHHPAQWDDEVQAMTNGRLEVLMERTCFVELRNHEALRASQAALNIGKFHERYRMADAHPADWVIDRLRDDCAEVTIRANRDHADQRPWPVHLVGSVPNFDHAMLTRWTGWPDFNEGIYHYHLICVENLAAGMLMMPPPWDTHAINEALGIVPNEAARHTALGDTRWAMDVYARVFHLWIDEAPF